MRNYRTKCSRSFVVHSYCRRTVLLMLFASLGCRDATDPGSRDVQFRTRDSANVQIVEKGQSPGDGKLLPAIVEPQVSPIRLSDLGVIRGIIRIRDGRTVIADGSNSHLLFVSQSGELDSIVGRKGEGPGEFASIAGLYRCGGDTVAVTSHSTRLTLFNDRGHFVRSRTVPAIRAGTEGVSDAGSDPFRQRTFVGIPRRSCVHRYRRGSGDSRT